MNVRDERKHQGHTSATLAVAAGLSVKTIERAERGQPVSPNSLRHIARVLGVELNG
jgi:transcriptional regulator with XRE-family HTH domain